MKPRKTGARMPPLHIRLRFNEAGAMKPRKTSAENDHKSPGTIRFNEAGAMKPRKTVAEWIRLVDGDMLQ